MTDSIEVSSRATSPDVRTTFEIFAENPFSDRFVYVWTFHAKGNKTFEELESDSANLIGAVSQVGANGQLEKTVTATGLDPNETYSYMWSMTDTATFSPDDVIRRRPLSPPDTYTSASNPIWDDTNLPTATQGTFFSDGVDADLATSYTLIDSLPQGLSLNTNNGSINGTPLVNGFFSFRIDANNSFGSTRETIFLTINPPEPDWVDESLTSPAFIDAPYSDGVEAEYATSYSISAGQLPSGLTLNTSTGAITGTPDTEETQNFTIQASNVTGTISTSQTIEIISGLAPPTFTDDTLDGDLRVGISYSDSVSATDADSFEFVGTQPTGLTIDNSGNVTGTPEAQGEFTFDIRATNAAGSADAPFTLDVKPGGERFDGTDFQRIETLKRYDGSQFVDVQFVKRFDGTNWVDANL